MQMGYDGRFLFSSDPDHCCYLNKTRPMESLLMHYDIWVNGIRAEQSPFRSQMEVEQPAPHNVIRFHPLISWSNRRIYEYRKEYNLPEHPLEKRGYFSIGCEPCTRAITMGEDFRAGRWWWESAEHKECGLHQKGAQS
jgi:phosphoadenosine phosphosulfate reductase